jgi:isopentenyldiphosphate isomerase
MDELIDILDTYGKPTGTTALKSKAHRLGLFHATVHIWFYTDDGSMLLQQRGKHKETHPLLWSVSVAGHVGTGETLEKSALREIAEEIGLTVKKERLEKIAVFKSVQKHHEHLLDFEFQHTYLCELKVPLTVLKKQDSEVEALQLMPILDFETEIKRNKILQKYVPQDGGYYQTIIEAIKDRL